MKKTRIDKLLLERGLVDSRQKAQALIMAGDVLVGGTPVSKAGAEVDIGASLRLRHPPHKWVSRGGIKLEGALSSFGITPLGRVAADIGASTGGFTDCLLDSGVRHVWAVDVDTDQLDWRLRSDPRVRPVEGNARYLEPAWIGEPVGIATVDVSFISVRKILPALCPILEPGADLLVLVKPQFEVGRGQVGKGGIVRDPEAQSGAVEAVARSGVSHGLSLLGTCPAVITGKQGNQEHFVWFRAGGGRNTVPDSK